MALGEVQICRVLARRADYRAGDVSEWETVLTFASAGDEGTAQWRAGQAADAFTDATGRVVNWHVDALPYARAMDDGALIAWAWEQARNG